MHIALTETERQHLRQLQKQRRDEEGYVKVTVLLRLDAGRAAATVAQDLGLDDGTVYRYAQAWQRLGLEKYLLHERPGYWGLLPSAGLTALSREVEQTRYSDVRAIGAWLERCWGVRYSASGLTPLLHRLGFRYKLTTPVPCQADAARQATFLTDELLPLLARAEAGQALVYFADAAHPTHNTRSVRVWTRTGQPRPLPTVSGRERVNRNVALNAHAPTQLYVHEMGCVNAQSTRQLDEQLLAAHPDGRPIYVVCDNARYYKNRELAQWLRGKPLVQVFLPPYSPNLNLIERLALEVPAPENYQRHLLPHQEPVSPSPARLLPPTRRVRPRTHVLTYPQLPPDRVADQFGTSITNSNSFLEGVYKVMFVEGAGP